MCYLFNLCKQFTLDEYQDSPFFNFTEQFTQDERHYSPIQFVRIIYSEWISLFIFLILLNNFFSFGPPMEDIFSGHLRSLIFLLQIFFVTIWRQLSFVSLWSANSRSYVINRRSCPAFYYLKSDLVFLLLNDWHTIPRGIRFTSHRGSNLLNEEGWRPDNPRHYGWISYWIIYLG